MKIGQVRALWLVGALYLLSAVLVIGCTSNQLAGLSDLGRNADGTGEEALTEFVACGVGTSFGTWLLTYADETGLFHEYGLRPNIYSMQSGSSAMTALLAGDADICHISGSAIVNAALAVDDPVIVAGLINRQPYSLVVASDIEQPGDLLGKALAVSRPGSASDTILRKGLARIGLDPDTDVTIVSVGRMAERLAALESGQVAGTLFTLSELDNAKSAGFHVMLDIDDLDIPYQHSAIVTRRSFLANNQELVTNYLKAINTARAAMIMDLEKGPDIIADGLLLDSAQRRNNIRNIYLTVLEQYLVRLPLPSQEGLAELIKQGRLENPNARDITPDDIIDVTIVQELQDSGFIDALYERHAQE